VALRLATRGSALALTQARWVAERLGGEVELVEAGPNGPEQDKSRFVSGVERLLLAGEADLGVHSAKDLPGEMAVGLEIAVAPVREDPLDAWIGVGAGGSLADVPEGARVGTASLRRRAQLLAARPDLRVEELHGNVDTRLRKLAEEELDAIVLAAAGLRRLGRESEIGFALDEATMVPAPGQGCLALQVREGDEETMRALAPLGDERALIELTAERATVAPLDASCSTPIGVHARVDGEFLTLRAFVGLPDGSEYIRDEIERDAADPLAAGTELAERLASAGAADLLRRSEQQAAALPGTAGADGPISPDRSAESSRRPEGSR
jgi:hydroxymethylbilane synthase